MSKFKPETSIDLHLGDQNYLFFFSQALVCLHIATIIWKSVYKLSSLIEKDFSCAFEVTYNKGETCCSSYFKRIKDGEQLLVDWGPVKGNPQRTLKT